MEASVGRFASKLPGIHFLSIASLAAHGDRSFHAADIIRPPLKGSREMGAAWPV